MKLSITMTKLGFRAQVNAQEECYKAKAQLSAYQQKVYIEVDALHQRLKGRLEEIQDGLVVRQLTDVSKKRREDIANIFDKNKLKNRLSYGLAKIKPCTFETLESV